MKPKILEIKAWKELFLFNDYCDMPVDIKQGKKGNSRNAKNRSCWHAHSFHLVELYSERVFNFLEG